MATIVDCPGCYAGDHSRHIERHRPVPRGMMGGEVCGCTGDCAARHEKRWADIKSKVRAPEPDRFPTGEFPGVKWVWPSEVSQAIIRTLRECGATKPMMCSGDIERALRPHLDDVINAIALIKRIWDNNERALLFDAEARATWELCRRLLERWGVSE